MSPPEGKSPQLVWTMSHLCGDYNNFAYSASRKYLQHFTYSTFYHVTAFFQHGLNPVFKILPGKKVKKKKLLQPLCQ